MREFWCVQREGHNIEGGAFSREKDARAHAQKLADESRGSVFVVLRAVGFTRTPVDPVNEWMDAESAIDPDDLPF